MLLREEFAVAEKEAAEVAQAAPPERLEIGRASCRERVYVLV